jgi:hypothetical protein
MVAIDGERASRIVSYSNVVVPLAMVDRTDEARNELTITT